MDGTTQTVLIVAVVLAIALLIGRRFRVRWGNREAATGHGSEQTLRVSGPGSRAARVDMDNAGGGQQEVNVKGGGQAEDVKLKIRGDDEKDAADDENSTDEPS